MTRRWMQVIRALCICATLLVGGCAGQGAEPVEGKYVRVVFVHGDNAAVNRAELARRGDRVFEELSAYFERSVPVPVTIEIDEKAHIARSFAARNAIVLPMRTVSRNNGIVAHEMTHLFMPENRSEAMREGIAVYAQDRFGWVQGYPNFGADVDRLIVKRLSRGIGSNVGTFSAAEAMFRRNRGTDTGGVRLGRDKIDPESRRNAYLIAGSFVRYLLDDVLQGDMPAFKRLYVDGDVMRETGKTLHEIETAWRDKIGL